MAKLGTTERSILIDLYNATREVDDGADYLLFRVAHENDLTAVDGLENDGYIRRENERYFLSLTALASIDTSDSNELLQLAELIFSELKKHFRSNPRAQLLIKELCSRLGRDLRSVCTCLNYMAESGGWWAGRSTICTSNPDAYILPSDGILRDPTFTSVVRRLQTWQDERRSNRMELSQAPDSFSFAAHSFHPQMQHAGRRQPDWFAQLPPAQIALLKEIYTAIQFDLRAIASMGLRAVIDTVCVEAVGDIKTFKQKLEALKSLGRISGFDFDVLVVAIEAGNASAHRGFIPNTQDLETLLDVVERLLKTQYILPARAHQLAMNTPKRGG
jgi:hypothetical protein